MALVTKTTMPLLFLTIWCFFTVVYSADDTIESLPPHASHPTIPPVHPPTKAPVHPPTKAPVHPPTKAPVHPPTKAPVHPPTKAPVHPPTKAPVHPPTKAPVHPPTKAPVHPPTKAPVKKPVHPPTKAPVHPPTKAPVKKPVHPPTKAPVHHSGINSVAVHGAVYCMPCKNHGVYPASGASLLSGATVKLECKTTKHHEIVKAKTNSKGHFYLQAPETITSKEAHQCKVFLVSSSTGCSQKTNLNGGLNGAVMKLENKFERKQFSFSLYTLGPLAFRPKCRS